MKDFMELVFMGDYDVLLAFIEFFIMLRSLNQDEVIDNVGASQLFYYLAAKWLFPWPSRHFL